MVEEILSNLYRIQIPLPKSPLKALNSYLIKAQGQFLLIDTGWNQEGCRREMFSSLERLGVDLRKTDFFITHSHADHLGLVSSLAVDTSTVYLGKKDVSSAYYPETRWQEVFGIYLAHGFPREELRKAGVNHPGRRYGLSHHIDFSLVGEGDTIEIGDYCFRCVETPGHSPGHMCLYEADKKLLVSGDHILFDITPNITFWLDMENSLKEYLVSLDKVYTLDVNLVLPGHRNLWDNHRRRVIALREHHQARANEILSALESGSKTAFQMAPYVTWDVKYRSWGLFPASQKWFAVGETIAHLKYLEELGMIERKVKENRITFSLK